MESVADLLKNTSFLSSQSTLHTNMLIHQAWNDASLDTELKQNTKIKKIQGTTVHLVTSNGVWAQEVRLQANIIIKKINIRLRQKTQFRVKELVVFSS